ncbi:hypothetical protein Bca4012_080826 [Brassica carinata]
MRGGSTREPKPNGGAACDLHLHLSQIRIFFFFSVRFLCIDPIPLETLAFLQLMTFSLRPPEFLNNRTEADEEATAKDAEHAKPFWLISRMKGSPFDDVNCVSSCLGSHDYRAVRERLLHTYGFSWFIGVVMEAKPQLVGIHERVRNDIVHNLLKRMVESEYLLQPIQMQKKLQIS